MSAVLSFEGQVAIVTGAGRGLGRVHALELARRGASVVANDLSGAEGVVAEIVAAGGKAVGSSDSVATPEGGAAIVQQALDSFGTVDIVINNAGFPRWGYFEDLTVAAIREVIDVHVLGAFWVTQPAWRVMKERGYGRVLITSSSAGMLGHHASANYSAAKAGLYGLMKVLAFEGQEYGIKVNALLPGAQSDFSEGNPLPDFDKFPAVPELVAERWQPEPVTSLVAYLVSRDCPVTGEAFRASYGLYGRVFVGVAHGWLASDAAAVSAEDVRDHFDQIRDLEGHTVPTWVYEEVQRLIDRVQALE